MMWDKYASVRCAERLMMWNNESEPTKDDIIRIAKLWAKAKTDGCLRIDTLFIEEVLLYAITRYQNEKY